MRQGFADVWALMRCWRLAAGLPSAVAFGYRAVRSLATAYERVVAPIVGQLRGKPFVLNLPLRGIQSGEPGRRTSPSDDR